MVVFLTSRWLMITNLLDYEKVSQLYKDGKKDVLGVRLNKTTWFVYDETNDRFIFHCILSRVYEENGRRKNAEWKERAKFTMEPLAYVFKDHAELLYPKRMNPGCQIARNFFWKYFRAMYGTSDLLSIEGYVWKFFGKNANFMYARYSTVVPKKKIYSANGVVIKDDDAYASQEPMKQVDNTAKRKELNALINKVKKGMRLRFKLGAFPPGSISYDIGGDDDDNDDDVLHALRNVNDEDITSYTRLLKLCVAGCYSHSEWLEAFEKNIEYRRRRLHQLNGSFTYE